MQRFTYETSYLPMPYSQAEKGFWIFKNKELPLEPDIGAFLQGDHAKKHMAEWGEHGYELVSVQPVLKAVVQQSTQHGPSPWGFGYPLTAGFVLFWRKESEQ